MSKNDAGRIWYGLGLDNSSLESDARKASNIFRGISETVITEGKKIDNIFRNISVGVGGLFIANKAKEFIVDLAKVRGEFQEIEVSLETILNSKPKADKLMSQVVEYAATTRFNLTDVAQGAKQLLAYGFEAEKIIENFRMLGDVAAGLSIPIGDLVYLYGTLNTQGRAYTRDILQFTTRGIPIIEGLAKQLGVAEDRIQGMVESGQIGFPVVEKAFKAMTSEGGKFYDLTDKLSNLIPVQASNFADAWDKALNKMGKSTEGLISGSIKMATDLVNNYEEIGEVILELVAVYGTYKAALITINSIQKLNMMVLRQATLEKKLAAMATIELSNAEAIAASRSKLATIAFVNTGKALKSLSASVLKNPYAILTAAVVGLAYGWYKLITAETEAEKAQIRLEKATKDVDVSLTKELSKLALLERQLVQAKKGSDEWNSAKEAIVTGYGKYFSGLDSEITRVGNLSGAYSKLVEAMRQSIGQRSFMSFYTAEQENFDNTLGEALDKAYSTLLKKYGKDKGLSLYQQFYNSAVRGEKLDQGTWRELNAAAFTDWGFSNSPVGISVTSVANLISGISNARKAMDGALKDYQQKYNLTDRQITDAIGGTENGKEPPASIKVSELVDKIKSATAALDDLRKKSREGLISTSEVQKQEDALDDLKKQFKLMTGKEYDNKKLNAQLDAIDSLNEKIEAGNLALVQSSIDMMKDGKAKELAIIDQRKKEELAKITKDQNDLESLYRKTNKKITQEQLDEFEKRSKNVKKVAENDKREVEKKYTREIADVYRQLTTVFMTEEEKKRSETEKTYRDMLEWAKKMYQGGGINKFEFMKISGEIERAKNKALLADSLKEFGTYQTKKELIEKEYNDKIYSLRKNGYEAEAKNAESARELALFELRISQEEFYKVLFGDLQKYSVNEINLAISNARDLVDSYIKSAEASGRKLTPDEIKAVESLLESIKKVSKEPTERLRSLVSVLNELGRSGQMLGGLVGEISSYISGVASNLDGLFKVLDESSSKTDKIAAGIQGVASIISMIGGQIAENKRAQDAWNASIAEAAKQAAIARIELDAYKETNLFGVENPYSRAIAGAKQYATSMIELYGAAKKLEDGQVQTGTKKVISASNVGTGVASGAAAGAAIGSLVPVIGTAIGAVIGSVIGGIAGLISTKTVPVFESLKKKYGEIYDPETFELNPAILADYAKLDEATKKLVDNWKEIKNKALEAQNQMRENFKDLAGDMGTQLSDALEAAFREGRIYNAVDDYKKYVTSQIGDIIEQLIFSAQFGKLFDELENRFNSSFGANGDMNIVDDMEWFLSIYQSQIDGYNEAMKKAQEAAKARGIDLWQDDSTRSGLSKGIAQASQESVDTLGGTATTIMGHTYSISENIKMMLSINNEILENVKGIKKDTARLQNIEKGIDSVRSDINDITVKGIKLQ